jgi:hypothetical protein
MNKSGIITAGVFSTLTAIGCLVAGIVILQNWDDLSSECPVLYLFESDDYLTDENETCDFVTWAVLTFVACALWTAITVGIFAFACSNRLEKSEHADYPDQTQGVELTTPATASAMATPISSGFASIPTHTTITYLPDGTQKTEMAVTNPDGSITMQTTFDNVAKIDAKV